MAVASLKEIRISALPSFFPTKTAFFWSTSRTAGSDDVIFKYGDLVRFAVVFIPFRPMTVYGWVSPTVRTTGFFGSSHTAFQLIPATATLMTNVITYPKSCRDLRIRALSIWVEFYCQRIPAASSGGRNGTDVVWAAAKQ